jgi:hypothetical protein
MLKAAVSHGLSAELLQLEAFACGFVSALRGAQYVAVAEPEARAFAATLQWYTFVTHDGGQFGLAFGAPLSIFEHWSEVAACVAREQKVSVFLRDCGLGLCESWDEEPDSSHKMALYRVSTMECVGTVFVSGVASPTPVHPNSMAVRLDSLKERLRSGYEYR